MVRATTAEMKKLTGGVWPANLDDTNMGNIATQAYNLLNAYIKKYYDADISSDTGDQITLIENMVGVNIGMLTLYYRAGGPANEKLGLKPVVFNDEIKLLIDAYMSDTTYDGATTINMQKGYRE